MNRLLLVEDDEALALGIEFTLKDEGYDVLRASTYSEGKNIFEQEKLDLIILDVNLPDGSGYDLCKYIRGKSEVPIIFLTALDEEVNVVVGFEIGGDDYITKPFRVRELLSRIKAILRRNSKTAGSKIVSGEIAIDTSSATVKKKGKELVLTAQEYKLLLIFISRTNVLIKREEILKELLEGADVFFDENTLSVYIKRIQYGYFYENIRGFSLAAKKVVDGDYNLRLSEEKEVFSRFAIGYITPIKNSSVFHDTVQ